jgi:AcrR family transcriptional regulator
MVGDATGTVGEGCETMNGALRASRKSERPTHPTKIALLEAGRALAEEHGLYGYTVEMLLDSSGISKGSLYHHFSDFMDFVESVQVEVFAESVRVDIDNAKEAFERATSKEDFRRFILAVVGSAFLPDRPDLRLLRASMVGATRGREEYRARLGAEQLRLREMLADVIIQAQNRGWVRPEVDPDTGAVFMLAYSFGLVIDEVTGKPVDPQGWQDLVMAFMDRVMLVQS